MNSKETEKLKKELDWFRNFGYKVNELSSSVNNKACKYADAMQEDISKRVSQSDVEKYADWILTQCDKPKDEITWLIQTILESDNFYLLSEIENWIKNE